MGISSETEPLDANQETDTAVGVQAHETRPGRTVFTEDENVDGWIATDHTVELRR